MTSVEKVPAAPVPELVYRLADGQVVTIPEGVEPPAGAMELRPVAPKPGTKVELSKVYRLSDGSVVTVPANSGPPAPDAVELIDPSASPVNPADRKLGQWPPKPQEATGGRFVPGDPNAIDPAARFDRHVADSTAPENDQGVAAQWRQARRHDGHTVLVGPGDELPEGYRLMPPVAAP